jgi:Zn-dependent oligopeptidase
MRAGNDGSVSPAHAPLHSSVVLQRVHENYSLVPHLAGTTWQADFLHAVTYGAGYYSYM